MTILGIGQSVDRFMRGYEPNPENLAIFVSTYSNPNSHNNAEKAMRHLARFLEIDYKGKMYKVTPNELLIAPTDTQVRHFLSAIDRVDIRLYLGLLTTTLIRPDRLWRLRWMEVKDGFIHINENVRTKNYRPNPIHPKLLPYLDNHQDTQDERVFPYRSNTSYRKAMQRARNLACTNLNRSKLRDYAYNTMRKAGMDRDIVDWLAGHTLGIRAHYLADNVVSEYQKFVDYTERIDLMGTWA